MSGNGYFRYQDGCVFCERIANGEYDYETSEAVIFEPLNPVVPGHMLAVPKSHAASAVSGPSGAGAAVTAAAYYVSQRDGLQCNLIFNVGPDADQTIFHSHLHIVPRRKGDGLKMPWSDQQGQKKEKHGRL